MSYISVTLCIALQIENKTKIIIYGDNTFLTIFTNCTKIYRELENSIEKKNKSMNIVSLLETLLI